jgi:D-glycero-alpha-D-manno-heptose-7-phosphate kinase
MRTVTGRVPVRIDLAGGTLDIWPIHLTLPEPGVTVNVALDVPATVSVAKTDGTAVRVAVRGVGGRQVESTYPDMDAVRASFAREDDANKLFTRAVEALAPEGGLSLDATATAPQGSGLGGSSALLACAVATLAHAVGRPLEREAVRRVAQDLETWVIRGPTGYQDYYPPLFGGCLALEGRAGGVMVERLPVDLGALARRLRLVYTGAPHHSGITNWGAMRAYFDGERQTVDCLRDIAALSRLLRDDLRRGDLDAALAHVVEEGRVRLRMAPGVATEGIHALDRAVSAAGALGTKVLGAGGGGCVLVVLRDEREPVGLEAALRGGGGTPMPVRLPPEGLVLTEAPAR